MEITSGRIAGAIKAVVYGPEGIGKTTFASKFPEPLFIDTEDSTVHMDVRRLPKPYAWSELLGEVNYIYLNPQLCKTLVVDTLDWAERLCCEHVCARDQKTGIEDYGYGKGYKYVQEEFGRLLDALELVRRKGVYIVLCCHAAITKFEQPDELGAYDRWGLKLISAPKASIAGMVKEWADLVIFANYKTIVVNTDGKGAAKGKNKAQGGRRVMYMTHHPCWDAKNRFGLPEEADFSYEVIREVVEGSGGGGPLPSAAKTGAHSPEGKAQEGTGDGGIAPMETAEAQETDAIHGVPTGGAVARGAGATEAQTARTTEAQAAGDAEAEAAFRGIPEGLARMMKEAQVTPDEVKVVIAQKGIYPVNTSWRTICENEQFMKGWLLHPQVWPQVVNAVRGNREDDEVPF